MLGVEHRALAGLQVAAELDRLGLQQLQLAVDLDRRRRLCRRRQQGQQADAGGDPESAHAGKHQKIPPDRLEPSNGFSWRHCSGGPDPNVIGNKH